MTTLQKIKNLIWFNQPEKLKPILLDLYNRSEESKLTQDEIDALDNSNSPSEVNRFATISEVYNILNGTSITLPTFADNASAILGGLETSRRYKTPAGDLKTGV